MHLNSSSFVLCSVLSASLLGACTVDETGEATQATTPVGASGTILSKAHLGDLEAEFKWHDQVGRIEADSTLFLQQVTLQPGGDTGWHGHHGPAIVHILSGSVLMADEHTPCVTEAFATGSSFIDMGNHAHHVWNPSTTATAVVYAHYFVPAGGVVRIDRPAPAGADACP